VHVNKATTANFGQIPGLTSTAYVQYPNINYAIPQFDSTIPPTQSGLQQAGAAGKVKAATSTATLSGLQMIKANNFVFEDSGFDMYREGWLFLDQILRMATGADPIQNEPLPLRVFTADNVSSLTVDNNAFQTGAWFGNADYKNVLLQLWGVS
jgi:ribose transport system substrate-binding protein